MATVIMDITIPMDDAMWVIMMFCPENPEKNEDGTYKKKQILIGATEILAVRKLEAMGLIKFVERKIGWTNNLDYLYEFTPTGHALAFLFQGVSHINQVEATEYDGPSE